MRVLIALLAMGAGGCYSPDVEDCQFRCGPGNACPDGTSCMAGLCRSEMSVSCPPAPDACLVAPPAPGGCSPSLRLEGGTLCATVCGGQRSWQAARMDCAAAGWQLAILDNAAKLTSAPMSFENHWVGANRATSSSPWQWLDGTPVASDAWSMGTPSSGSGGDCAHLGGMSRRLSNSRSCSDTERFVCTFEP